MKKLASIIITFFLIILVNCAVAAESNNSSAYKVHNPDESGTPNISQIEISVHGINDEPVRGAKILLNRSHEISGSQDIYLFTDSNGTSAAQVIPGTYNFTIQARNYENESKTITIFNEALNTIEFTLIPDAGYDVWIFFLPVYLGFLLYLCWLCGSSEKIKLVFILFLLSVFIPLLFLMSSISNSMFFYISVFFSVFTLLTLVLLYLHFCKKLTTFTQDKEKCSKVISNSFGFIRAFLTILTILSWPLIAFYFACEGIETVVISDLNFLEFPSYIVIGVTIGVLSYLMLTIKNTFVQLLPDYERMRMIWECTRRIIIAPYVAIMGVYLIVDLTDGGLTALKLNIRPNTHFIFLFSIFAGMFTSTIEEWIYNKISNILSLDKRKQQENILGDIKNSELVNLKMNEDMIYRLYYEASIATMEDLANCDAKSVFDKLKARYSETEIRYYIDYASKLKDSKKTSVN